MGTLMGTTLPLRLLILVGSPQLQLTSRESVPPVATVPSTWGMHYGPGMAGVEYPTVSAMLSVGQACDRAQTHSVPVSWVGVCLGHLHALCLQGWVRPPGVGKFRLARPVTACELTPFPSPGSESVSATYMPCASRGEFVSLASGNFGSPYVVPAPTSPPSVTRMSVGSVTGSSSEGVCLSTSSGDSASARRSSLEDQGVRDQLRQFRHMLEGLERRLDNCQRDSPQPRQPVAAPPGFAALPLAESHPSPVV